MRLFLRGVSALVLLAVTFYGVSLIMQPMSAGASGGAGGIRQEVNIIDGYLGAASGSFATSSAVVQINGNNYTAPSYYFEVVASTSASIATQVFLRNATSSATVATIDIPAGTTAYTRLRSSEITTGISSSTHEFVAVVASTTGATKGVIAARIVILDSGSPLTNMETQMEIGSQIIASSTTATLPLQNPKYWYYNSAGWDASPTFYAEVTYQVHPVSSSTIYRVSATSTTASLNYVASFGVGFIVAEAWGGGGGADGVDSGSTIGGGGGGGGAYARATTTVNAGSVNTISVGSGGGERSDGNVSSLTTALGVVVSAAGGHGGFDAAGGATTTSNQSIGQVIFNGGAGGAGETTADTGGAGGGAAGPDGNGVWGGKAAASGPGGTGGNGDNSLGGAGGAGGNGGDDTCDTEIGKPGVSNVLGGGGAGGADGDVSSTCPGGAGGAPGGGGGGSDEGTTDDTHQIGGPGQVKITEWIGTVGIALQEDDGQFANWTLKQQLVVAGATSTQSTRIRGAAFTPTNGKHYRLVASTTNATASFDIYNAKIVVNQNPVTLDQSNSTNGATAYAIKGGSGGAETEQAAGQSFTAGATYSLSRVDLDVYKNSSPTDNLILEILTGSITGTVVGTSDPVPGTSLGTADDVFYTFNFSTPVSITNGVQYFMRLSRDGARDATNQFQWSITLSNNYAGGGAYQKDNNVWGAEDATRDTEFKIYQPASAITLLEPQYLLANTKLAAGTSLQNYLTSFNTSEWSTTNNYLHAVSSGPSENSTIEIDSTTGPAQITGSEITNPNNYATSTGMCLTSNATLDTLATVNGGNVYSSSIIAQVGVASTAECGGGTAAAGPQTWTIRDGTVTGRDATITARDH